MADRVSDLNHLQVTSDGTLIIPLANPGLLSPGGLQIKIAPGKLTKNNYSPSNMPKHGGERFSMMIKLCFAFGLVTELSVEL